MLPSPSSHFQNSSSPVGISELEVGAGGVAAGVSAGAFECHRFKLARNKRRNTWNNMGYRVQNSVNNCREVAQCFKLAQSISCVVFESTFQPLASCLGPLPLIMTARSVPLRKSNATQAGALFSVLEATSFTNDTIHPMNVRSNAHPCTPESENFVGTLKIKKCFSPVKRSQQGYITQPENDCQITRQHQGEDGSTDIDSASRGRYRRFILLTHLTGFLWRGEHRRYHLEDAVQSNVKPCDTNHNLPHSKPQG